MRQSGLDDSIAAELSAYLSIYELLGQGTAATVWLARETDLDRLVALKVLRPEAVKNPRARRRFEREARAIARLDHPHIARIYRIGRVSSGVPFIVMEFIDGRSYTDFLQATGPLSAQEARRVLSELARALAAAQRAGVIHRDIRPANVLRERETGRTVLTDFGIAALGRSVAASSIEPLTATGELLGQPQYASPEQLRGEVLDARTDVYSLGVLACELVTLRTPYQQLPPSALLSAKEAANPHLLNDVRRTDEGLADVVQHCLAPDSRHRPDARDIPRLLGDGRAPVKPDISASPKQVWLEFTAELRRRKVYKVAATYLAAAFVVLEGMQLLTPGVHLAAVIYPLLAAGTVAGFPVALILGWIFDITSRGIRRTGPGTVSHDASRLMLAFQIGAVLVTIGLSAALIWLVLA